MTGSEKQEARSRSQQETHDALACALQRLTSLHDGERGLSEVVRLGTAAIPHLRRLLFDREPSGLFQPRCRAVDALAALGACDVLLDFLGMEREIADPVERMGEDAVMNAAARALTRCRDERVVPLLLSLACTRKLAGAIRALGALRCTAALPCMIEALADDLARPAAEAALRAFGSDARCALLAAALRVPQSEPESESDRRRRCGALRVLLAIGVPGEDLPDGCAGLIMHRDPETAALAARLCLRSPSAALRARAMQRVIDLRQADDWQTRIAAGAFSPERDVEAAKVQRIETR